MAAAILLRELEKLRIELWTEGEQLKFRAPPGAMSDALRLRIGSYRRDLIELLAGAGRLSAQHAAYPGGDDDLPLTPHQAWYVDTFDPEKHAWAITVAVQLPDAVPLERLRAAVEIMLKEHDVFRLRLYRAPEGRWAQRILRNPGPAISVHDVTAVDEAERMKQVNQAAHQVQSSLSVIDGPVWALALCTFRGQAIGTVIFSAHHFVVDGYSLELAIGELLRVYQALAEGRRPDARAAASTYRDYLLGLDEYLHQPAFLARALAFWRHPDRLRPMPRLPVDVPGGRHTTLNSRRVVTPLEPALARDILSYLRSHENVFINDVLLFALAQAYYRWTAERSLRVDVEYHGRDVPGLRLLETIGPMTVKVPVLLELEPERSTDDALALLRDRVRETEANARGYGLFRYKCTDAGIRQEFAASPPAQVFLNNRMRLGESRRPQPSATATRVVGLPQLDVGEHLVSYDLMIDCDNFQDTFVFSWTYSSASYREQTVRALTQHFVDSLGAVANISI